MTVARLFPSGAYEISAFVGDRLVTRRYFGYTRREAVAEFRAELREMKKEGQGVL